MTEALLRWCQARVAAVDVEIAQAVTPTPMELRIRRSELVNLYLSVQKGNSRGIALARELRSATHYANRMRKSAGARTPGTRAAGNYAMALQRLIRASAEVGAL